MHHNPSGMTFIEWLNAAGKDTNNYGPIRLIWQSAWQAGEDPCEWRRQ